MWKHVNFLKPITKYIIYAHIFYHMYINYTNNSKNILENIFFMLHMNLNFSFLQNLEKIILLSIFNNYNSKEACLLKYHNIFNENPLALLQNIILLEIDMYKHLNILIDTFHFQTVLFSIITFTICLLLQYNIRFSNKNTRRKLFHLFLMIYYWNNNDTKQLTTVYLLIILLYFNNYNCLKPFLRRDEHQNIILPHIILLASFLYTSHLQEYKMYIITMCVLDTCASIPGTLLCSKTKTVYGSVFGVTCAIIIHTIMVSNRKIWYYVLCGCVEYFCSINDNLALPYFSLIVLR